MFIYNAYKHVWSCRLYIISLNWTSFVYFFLYTLCCLFTKNKKEATIFRKLLLRAWKTNFFSCNGGYIIIIAPLYYFVNTRSGFFYLWSKTFSATFSATPSIAVGASGNSAKLTPDWFGISPDWFETASIWMLSFIP